MAGSYSHVTPALHGDKRKYRGDWSMIENMGDAYECVEELLWLVFQFARIIALSNGETKITLELLDKIIRAELAEGFVPMSNGARPKDAIFRIVELAMENRSGEVAEIESDLNDPLALDAETVARMTRERSEQAEQEAIQKVRRLVREELVKQCTADAAPNSDFRKLVRDEIEKYSVDLLSGSLYRGDKP